MHTIVGPDGIGLVGAAWTLPDADLIAAAPDLLAALKEMVEAYASDDGISPEPTAILAARAAIAKAEG